jgi:hypothetical protein
VETVAELDSGGLLWAARVARTRAEMPGESYGDGQCICFDLGFCGGAGDGNRTRMTSLEDRCAQWSVTSENIAAGRWRAHARELP